MPFLSAYDFLNKPLDNEELILTIKRAVEERAMRQEIHTLKTQLNLAMPLFEQVGNSDEKKYRKEIPLKESFAKDKMTRAYKNGVLEIKLVK